MNKKTNKYGGPYLVKIISEAPLTKSLKPPPFLGTMVLIDFLTELKVYTLVNISSGTSSRIVW